MTDPSPSSSRRQLAWSAVIGAAATGAILFIVGLVLLRAGPEVAQATPRPTGPATTAPTATPADAPDPTPPMPTPTAEGHFLPAVMKLAMTTGCDPANVGGQMTGQLVAWHTLTVSYNGPTASETDNAPNPFLDYRLNVLFIGPSGQSYLVPGFFAGDGQGSDQGDVWQARFTADEAGQWRYCASFRTGKGIAVELDPLVGEPTAFDGTSGIFTVAPTDRSAPGFLRWGRLEYVGGHYLKFRDGPYWLKGGTNSPENFLGYAGFDNTVDQGGILADFLHHYSPHGDDWRDGDPQFASADTGVDARGIVGALNYLADQHVNSIYLLPLNLGGDGQETYPFIDPDDRMHYDVSKLHQWNVVMEHAQQQGIAIHMVLNEAEEANRHWLDAGQGLGIERKLFYREMVARFGHLLALKWNLSEEAVFLREELLAFADYIHSLDWAGHTIAIHNPAGWQHKYEEVLGQSNFSATSMQYDGTEGGALVEAWRNSSAAAGVPWVIDMDENNPAGVGLTPDNAGTLRKEILYDVYFSGAGGVEWYAGYHELPVGGDVNLENFRTREAMWQYTWYARQFMQQHLPFWLMTPADELLTGETEQYGGGEVLALAGEVYAVYLPVGEPAGRLQVVGGSAYTLRWYNPRTGEFEGQAATLQAMADGLLLAPPHSPPSDWVTLVERVGFEDVAPPSYP